MLAHAARAAVAARAHVVAVDSDDSGADANINVGTVTRVLRMVKAVKPRKRPARKPVEGRALAEPAAIAACMGGGDWQSRDGGGHVAGVGEEEKRARKRAKRLNQKQRRAETGAAQDWKAKLKARKERKKARLRQQMEGNHAGAD